MVRITVNVSSANNLTKREQTKNLDSVSTVLLQVSIGISTASVTNNVFRGLQVLAEDGFGFTN